eukprot:91125_1
MYVTSAIQLCLWTTIYLPFTTYLLYNLWKHRRNSYFRKRNPKLLFAIVIFSFLIYTNTVLLWQGYHSALCVLTFCKSIPQQISKIIITSFLYGLYLTSSVRVWLLYFNLRWSEEIKLSEWVKQINISSIENNFFLKYKSTPIGSFKKMKWYILIFYFILISIFSAIVCYDVSLFAEMNGVSIFMVFTFQIVILYRTKNDVFYIRKEMVICTAIWLMIAAYYAITIPLKLHDKYMFVTILTPYIAFIGGILINAASILYPLYHLHNMNFTEGIRLSEAGNCSLLWTEYVSSCRNNFDNFMNHLVKEYSVENLLFILEVMQFKAKNFDDTSLNKAINKDTNVGYYLHLPSDITKSTIIYGKETIHPLQQILSLYNKYIIRGAPLQVNISYSACSEIEIEINSVIMNKNNFKFNPLIFDSAVIEIVSLVNDSWCRYKSKSVSKHTPALNNIKTASSMSTANNSKDTPTVTTPSTVDPHSIEITVEFK